MKAYFETLVLHFDTDSLIYEIELEDLYDHLEKNDAIYQEYDFSNYSEDNKLYSKHQKPETLKFKDEMGGKVIHSVNGLKAKLFNFNEK